jgi:hypothetical protein
MRLSTFVLIVAACGLAFVTLKFGVGMLRAIGTPLPGPPPEGEMRRITLRYRCSLCGLEIRTVLSPEQDPPAPRHCQEDMDLVAPIE